MCLTKSWFLCKSSHWAIIWYDILIPWVLQGWRKNNVGKFNSSQQTSWKRPNGLKFSHGATIVTFSK